MSITEDIPSAVAAHLPAPPSERGAWLLAGTVCATGALFLILVLTGLVGSSHPVAPPAVPVIATTPAPAGVDGAVAPQARPGAVVARPSAAAQRLQRAQLSGAPLVHISRRWMEGFYPIYETAQRTFGVDWLLLASIHMQESAFSTAPGTYHGLNFAHCCGGPMQFNVTNGGAKGVPSTWSLVSDSYIYGRRPASYDHQTRVHPSIYDDFDAIMAAAHLLSADGAGYELGESAWDAAYDYYGHDLTGVLYADQVLARAIGWSQHGFCINCGVSAALTGDVHAAYGAPVEEALLAEVRALERQRLTQRADTRRSGTAKL